MTPSRSWLDQPFFCKEKTYKINIHVPLARVKGSPPSLSQMVRVQLWWLSARQVWVESVHWFGLQPRQSIFCNGLQSRTCHVPQATGHSEAVTMVFPSFWRVKRCPPVPIGQAVHAPMPIMLRQTNIMLPTTLFSWPTTADQIIKAYATRSSLL